MFYLGSLKYYTKIPCVLSNTDIYSSPTFTGTFRNDGDSSLATTELQPFHIYLKQVASRRLLTPEEEQEIALRVRAGDKRAEKKLIEGNLRFVITVARTYSNQGLPLEDLVNAGNVGLIRAVRRFQPEKNFKFISYAVWWVRQAILQELADTSRIVRMPLNQVHRISVLRKKQEEFMQAQEGRTPSTEELAEATDMDEGSIRALLSSAARAQSLDACLMDSDRPLIETMAGDDIESELEGEDRRVIDSILTEVLDERELTIIREYFGLNPDSTPHTLEEIGQTLKLTRERVRQLRDKALQKLKPHAEEFRDQF